CGYVLETLSDISLTTVSRHDRIVVMASGRSDNLQNRVHIECKACFKIGDREESEVDVKMQLSFDSENGYLGLMEQYSGAIDRYYNGTYSVTFNTSYFEVGNT
ncbi:hypothetical protein PENTCL1PPCAC_18812, partial [Pristionchus entomophagus]